MVLCIYCRTTCRISGGGQSPATPVAGVQPDTERVIQLVVDGKRDEAVALYARTAQVDPKEAAAAVDQLVASLVLRLSRRVPIAWGAIPILLAIHTGMALGATYGAYRASGGSVGFGILAAVLGLLAIVGLRNLARHARSTFVLSFGTEGRAKVVRRAIIREGYRGGGTLLVVGWEVRPLDGSAPFYDDETMLVLTESVPKLDPGNVIRVRYGGGRTLVFPVRPITVLGRE